MFRKNKSSCTYKYNFILMYFALFALILVASGHAVIGVVLSDPRLHFDHAQGSFSIPTARRFLSMISRFPTTKFNARKSPHECVRSEIIETHVIGLSRHEDHLTSHRRRRRAHCCCCCCCCCLHIESPSLPSFISTPSVRPDSLILERY